MSHLKLYNSFTREKTVFTPLDREHVKLYACGPTVYNYAHIGNARMAVVFDLLARVLKHMYPRVTYVSNITDVDDKIMIAALEQGVEISEITQKYETIYNEDMATLGAAKPDIQPRATEHIDEMITQIKQLIARGHAYEADGHVCFNVPSFPAYGGLSGRSRDDQIAGARVEIAPYKKDAADFVLWKPSAAHEPGWESPWGYGRPGWHIECSAMAEKHLGLPFDIHGGGADLKFPHHENEIAQSCCAHGAVDDLSAFAKVWVHNGFVTVEGEKMSKSLGNVQLVHDLIKDHNGEALRLTLLSAHYRQPLDWSVNKITQSTKTLDKFYKRLDEMMNMTADADAGVPAGVLNALYDDLNTPKAMAEMNILLREENSPTLKAQLINAGALIGILQNDSWSDAQINTTQLTAEYTAEINALIQEREQARAEKNWARSDEIRDELAERGIEIQDGPDGATWEITT